jgi:hypothetical protein
MITAAALANVGVPVYPTQAPQAVADDPAALYAVYQSVGGIDEPDLDNEPDELQNSRMQVSVWSPTLSDTLASMSAIRKAMLAAGCRPIGGAVSTYEEDTKRFGSTRDFSVWFRESE